MITQEFEFRSPAGLEEALKILADGGDDVKVLSGGMSLMPMMALGLVRPRMVLSLNRIESRNYVREDRDALRIGAGTRHFEILGDPLVVRHCAPLADAAAFIGDTQVRNRGTIGGSLAHADPAADYPAAVLALDGEVRLEGAAGARSVKAGDFFVDLMTTAMRPGEILTAVSFAPLSAGAGFAYLKYRQPASGFAIVGVAVSLTLDKSGRCQGARVGITGLGPKAFRAAAVENALNGKAPEATALAAAAAHAADGVDPLSDIHASTDFRAELARVYTRRAIESAAGRARR